MYDVENIFNFLLYIARKDCLIKLLFENMQEIKKNHNIQLLPQYVAITLGFGECKWPK